MPELARFSLDMALLGLVMETPIHGYDLYAAFQHELGPIWRAGRSQVYAMLHDLESRGFLASQVEVQEHRPTRHIFQITPAGRSAFLSWVRSPVQHIRDIRVEFLAKLVLMRVLGLPGADELLAEQIGICHERLANLSDGEGQATTKLVQSFRRSQIRAIIGWLESARAELPEPWEQPPGAESDASGH